MDINKVCLAELGDMTLFENLDHFSRFSELFTCYSGYPFFTRGIAKCMYLSSWDMEHFIVILDILNSLTIGKSQNLELMKDNGKTLEERAEGDEKYIMQLSACFLNNEEFVMPEEKLSEEGRHIILRALEAGKAIDHVFDEVGR